MKLKETKLIRNSTAEFLIFSGQLGEQSIEARYEDETVWLTQKLMAELFAVDYRFGSTVCVHRLKRQTFSRTRDRASCGTGCPQCGSVWSLSAADSWASR